MIYGSFTVSRESGSHHTVKDLFILFISLVEFHKLAVAQKYQASLDSANDPVISSLTRKNGNTIVNTDKINFNLQFLLCRGGICRSAFALLIFWGSRSCRRCFSFYRFNIILVFIDLRALCCKCQTIEEPGPCIKVVRFEAGAGQVVMR